MLKGGTSEVVTQRNTVHRFSKAEAEDAVTRFEAMFEQARRNGDPLCYTDQSKGFGARSILIQQFGAKEKLSEVGSAHVRSYDQRMAARYGLPGQWYAPLLGLRDRRSGDLIGPEGAVLLVTDPTRLATHLDNWRNSGLQADYYELVNVLTDAEFDEFMRWADDRGCVALVDPLFDPATQDVISGVIVRSLESIEQEAREMGKSGSSGGN